MELHEKVKTGDFEAVRRLLDEGGDVNVPDDAGRTPLHVAVAEAHQEIVEVLILRGADIDVKAKGDMTSLHYVAVTGNEQIAEILISNGAVIDPKTQDGWTPATLAADHGNTDLVELFLSKGADALALNDDGRNDWQRSFWNRASWRSRKGENPDKVVLRIKAKYVRPLEDLQNELRRQTGTIISTDSAVIRQAGRQGLLKEAGISFVSSYQPYTAHLRINDSPKSALSRIQALQTEAADMDKALIAQRIAFYRLQGCTDRDIEHGRLTNTTFDNCIESWRDFFAECVDYEYRHIEDMIRANPDPDNTQMALELFFSETGWTPNPGDLLDFLFALPPATWQNQFLEQLQSIDIETIWKGYCRFTMLLNYGEQIHNQNQFRSILESWSNELSKKIAAGWVAPALAPEYVLLHGLFGGPPVSPASMLQEIRDALAGLSAHKKSVDRE